MWNLQLVFSVLWSTPRLVCLSCGASYDQVISKQHALLFCKKILYCRRYIQNQRTVHRQTQKRIPTVHQPFILMPALHTSHHVHVSDQPAKNSSHSGAIPFPVDAISLGDLHRHFLKAQHLHHSTTFCWPTRPALSWHHTRTRSFSANQVFNSEQISNALKIAMQCTATLTEYERLQCRQ